MRRATAIAAAGLCGALAGCGRAGGRDTLDRIRARGELSWGADMEGGEPYVFADPNDPRRLVGFEVEIAEALARRLGVRARFAHAQWSTLVPSLERGDFDVALNGLEATGDRAERLLLSRPYFVFAETLTVRRGAPYRSLEDLAGKRVGTLSSTWAHELLRNGRVEPVLYEGQEEPYRDLAAGRTEAVLLDDIVANRFGCTRPDLECVAAPVSAGTYVIGMRRTDANLARAIDRALAEMLRNGELRAILERWHLWNDRQTGPLPPSAIVNRSRRFGLAQLALFLKGAAVTLGLSMAAFAIAVPLGLLLAIGRIYGRTLGAAFAGAYVEVFRGTPVLLQLYVLYFGLAPVLRLGPVTAAILGLGLNYAAYEAEIYRGALQAIARGQTEAAVALGLSRTQTLRHVIVPQALRVALPSMTNDFVALLKDTSIVSVITVIELTKRMTIAAVDLRSWLLPGLLCAALYFLLSYPLARLARSLERRLSVDSHPRPL